ncbi:hypothetical protein EJB05_41239, partial [Eragrostis curvula]
MQLPFDRKLSRFAKFVADHCSGSRNHAEPNSRGAKSGLSLALEKRSWISFLRMQARALQDSWGLAPQDRARQGCEANQSRP